LNWRRAALLALVGSACFHAAYTPAKSELLAFGIIGYLVCLVQLARLRTMRQCFYTGLALGFACFAPQLECFWRIFGPAAIALWLVLAFWIALFLVLSHLALVRLGPKRAAVLIPFLWAGLEYFRSELYYLKFSWLNVGYGFHGAQIGTYDSLGVYGVGFCVAVWSTFFLVFQTKRLLAWTLVVIFLVTVFPSLFFGIAKLKMPAPNLTVAGVQLEFPDSTAIQSGLDRILAEEAKMYSRGYIYSTNVGIVVLSEYTLDGEPPAALKDWCRQNQKFLIVGGRDTSPGSNYYNTAFVISTNGEVVFRQGKSVPIQFFKDGLPAPEQKVWDSPWGKIGICICYDLSYTRVTDELVRQGAQMLIVPTMDVVEWGRHQHELHARVAPVRAAEYGIPIFRVASSGISQGVSHTGQVQSSAPFPGEGEIIFFGARLSPGFKGSLPLDRWLAPFCVVVTGGFAVWLIVNSYQRRKKHV
jgi:apolipoprotein N-acyltransferase